MARSGKTAQEFIQSSFSPIIAVLCSPKVEHVTSKNNLSFTELLQPFGSMDWEGQIREPGGSVCIVKNWKVIIRDVHWKPLPPTEARKQLNNAVLHNYTDKTVLLELDGRKFDVPQSTPWFEAWRETYLEVQFPSDHEYTNHFLSCIIVGTTLDDNIIDTFNTLNQQYAQLQNITPPKLPKWFNNGVLKSYLLLHDVSAVSKDKADAAFETLKQTFGSSNCFMLSINSKSTTDPSLPTDYWAQYIKRSNDSTSEILSPVTNLPTTPPDPQPFPVGPGTTDDGTVPNQNVLPEGLHPLTTSENDFYDNANSLQTHSFSGSSESMNVSVKPLDYSTEVHGLALNANDIDSIKKFLQEYAGKALLPYLEKQISQLSELVANRKGVSRSLLSATKRWFGTGKGGNTTGNNTVIYSSDCPELQLRRLGDLWFLLGQWQRAFDTYHTAKREFYADSAWLCYAGALEMAAVSAFMAGDANKKTHGYMEESIVTYLNTCRMVQYAVRATLLSVLCLSSAGLHGEAAKQLIRMTSEDSDLRSAMLLEQASLCFLSGPGSKAMCRKYAFHMVLAGHRFSKAGQKKHAYRCYNQAYQVYRDSGWRLSTDHVQFALGRLAGALRLTRDAVRWLGAPLAPAARHQPAAQQDAFLREYMLQHQQWVDSEEEFKEHLPVLPVPLLESEATSVLCVGPAPLSSPGRVPATSLAVHHTPDRQEQHTWHKLEEMLLQVVYGSVPMIFKPTVDLYTNKTDLNPFAPQGEPIQISITLRNPLKIVIILKDVELLWHFVSESDDSKQIVNNEPMVASGSSLESSAICGQKIKSVVLEGESSKMLTFSLTPLRMGRLCVQGVAYKLINAGEGGNENATGSVIAGKLNLLSGINASDKRLQITVIPPAPCLQMTFTESSAEVISGELRAVDVEIRNVGPVDAGPVYFAVSRPDCVQLLTPDKEELFKPLYDEKYKAPTVYSDERAARSGAWRLLAARHVVRGASGVPAGACARARLVLRARARAPALALLALYEPEPPAPPEPPEPPAPRAYRLLRHVFRFTPKEAVEISVTPRRSIKTTPDKISENMNLVTEIKNICGEKDDDISIEVLEASLLSRQWRLTGMIASDDKNQLLQSREKMHIVFQASRIFDFPSESKVGWSGLKIATGQPDPEDNIAVSPYSHFVTDYDTSIDNMEANVRSDTKAGLIQSMFVVRWKAHHRTKGTTVNGQHYLWLDDFTRVLSREREVVSPDAPLQLDEYEIKLDPHDTKKKSKDNVVVYRMEHSSLISHNFEKNKLCVVPITINIVNCYEVPVNVFIDMSKQTNREGGRSLGWCGALSGSGPDEAGVALRLERWEARRVRLRALCAAPGAYVVGSAFAVSAATADASLTLAHAHAPADTSLLVVQTP
ncbi:trafficking protein particle complex subunit 8 [Cydia splendana]|uniref:trafficking protein particle complex subunit 8 n=1 Tax=Cydia splendana TaxID=1100963 RepID=UPI0028F49418